MNRDEADRALSELGAAYDRVAGALYAIDSDPALGFLRSDGLRGTTLSVWTALRPEVDARWTEFTVLGEAMEQARTTRANRHASDREWAVLTRTLAVDLPRLAATTERGCATISAILADVNAAWTASVAAISPVTDAMAALSRNAADLGDVEGIPALERRATLAGEQVLADPLASAPRGTLSATVAREFSNLSADIGTASARLTDQARVRDSYAERAASLSARIDEVEQAEDRVRAAFAHAIEKIVDPGLPPAPRTCDVLRARLSDLDGRRAKKQWRRLADDVAMMEATLAHALQRAEELAEAANGLVARRDELRGRLDAYRAKAASHRLDEHDVLGPLHTTARDMLYTAPCDLHAATKAVYAYQKALTELVREDANR